MLQTTGKHLDGNGVVSEWKRGGCVACRELAVAHRKPTDVLVSYGGPETDKELVV